MNVRRKLAKLLHNLYEKDSFWEIWNIPIPQKKEETREYANKILREHVENIKDKGSLIKFLEARAMLHLKDMDFRKEADTEVTRARLMECLQLKDFVEVIREREVLRAKQKEELSKKG